MGINPESYQRDDIKRHKRPSIFKSIAILAVLIVVGFFVARFLGFV